MPAGLDVAAAAAALLSLVLGTGMQALFDPQARPPERMRATLATAVTALSEPGTVPHPLVR